MVKDHIMRNGEEPALLVVGHGSRDGRATAEFERLIHIMRKRRDIRIEGGFIELARPPISECVERLEEAGAST
ncbi:MAG: sirohydrochlorin chelatase, partial [Rubrobacteraceae bacterium]